MAAKCTADGCGNAPMVGGLCFNHELQRSRREAEASGSQRVEGIPVEDPKWKVIPGGIGLVVKMQGVEPFVIRIRSAEGFRSFVNHAMDAARDAWPEIAQEWDDVNTPLPRGPR